MSVLIFNKGVIFLYQGEMICLVSHSLMVVNFYISFLNETGAIYHPTLSSLPKVSGQRYKEGNRHETSLVHLADVEYTQSSETREGYISDPLCPINRRHLNKSSQLN